MKAYVRIPAPDAETADRLEARVRMLAEQAGLSYERLFTVHHTDGALPADAMPAASGSARTDEAYLTFDECVLAYFDRKATREHFNRLAGVKLTKKHRPLIERCLAECQGDPDASSWKSAIPNERAAQLFVLLIKDRVWLQLLDFMDAVETNEMGEPARLEPFRVAFEASLKQDGFWHPIVARVVRPPAAPGR
jgi:hypothetical protein